MNNSIWKLTALTGVIGLGCLVILWAQQGLTDPDPPDTNETEISTTESGNQSSQNKLENIVSSGQQEPEQFSTDWRNPEPRKLDDEKPVTPNQHLSESNSNNAVSNPFGDLDENASKIKQTNLTKTDSENTAENSNPFEDKTSAEDQKLFNSNRKTKITEEDAAAKSEKKDPVFLPELNLDKARKKDKTKKEEGPIFLPDSAAFQDKKESKSEEEKSSTSNSQGNPFANEEKPILLNREPVKTKTETETKNDKSPSILFPIDDSKDQQKKETVNSDNTQSQENDTKQVPDGLPLLQNNLPNEKDSQDNPFANKDLTKTKSKKTPPPLPKKQNAIEGAPTFPRSDVPPTSVGENKKTSTDSRTEKTEPIKPEVNAEKSQESQLSIEKIAPKQAVLGQSMIYRILVKNIGHSPAFDVVIEDTVPEEVTLKGTIPQARLKNRTLYWKIGKLDAGDSKKILVKVIPKKEGQISSSAKVNFTSKVASKTRIHTPKLKFNLWGPKKAELGDKITYRYHVENIGTVPVKDIWVRGLLPEQLSHPAGNDVESQIGTLSPGATKEITLQVEAMKSGTGIHRAILTAAGKIRLESQSAIVVQGEKIKITRYGPQSRPVGKQAVFTNMVTNKSQKTITGVVVSEQVPDGMQFLEATEGGQYDPARRTVDWPLKKLIPQESKSFKIKLIPRVRGDHLTVVEAADKSGMLSKTSSKFEVSGYALLRMEIPATKGPLEVGDTVSMTVTVRNRGTSNAKNIRLQFKVPMELKLLGIKGPQKFRQIGRTVEVDPVTQIPAGKSISFEVKLRATKSGDSRMGVQIRSDEMKKPLSREEAFLVLAQ